MTTSSRQHIQNLLARGESYASIGRKLGRDGSLVRQIALGKKPGLNLNASLEELHRTGEVSDPPLRRTSSSGTLARVRGRAGEESHVPHAPATQRIRAATTARDQPVAPQRNRDQGRSMFRHEVNRHPNGMEMHRITVPKRSSAVNRAEGNRIIVEQVLERARGEGRRMDATVWIDVERHDGSKVRLPVRLGGTGGYTAQSAVDAINRHGGNAWDWLNSQLASRYPKGTFKSMTISGVDINTWGAPPVSSRLK